MKHTKRKNDGIGYVMNDTDFSYYKIHWHKRKLGLKYQFIFIFIFNKFPLTCICCANSILCFKLYKNYA